MSWRGGLSKNLKELRFVMCRHSDSSQGIRDFVKGSYVPLKAMNPNFPLLVRESDGATAKVLARYAQGKENSIVVENLSPAQVEAKVQQLVQNKQ